MECIPSPSLGRQSFSQSVRCHSLVPKSGLNQMQGDLHIRFSRERRRREVSPLLDDRLGEKYNRPHFYSRRIVIFAFSRPRFGTRADRPNLARRYRSRQSGFTFQIFKAGLIGIIGFLPLLFIIAFSFLEFAIAFIQAQVFVVLTSGYIKDGLDLH